MPAIETSALDGEINALLYLRLNSARWEDGELRYTTDALTLAERWEFGPDSTTLTYYLRPDAVWSDGEPIDARDVVFTFELVRKPEIGSVYADVWEHLDSVVAVGEREVRFYFARRYPGMLFDTGIGIVPAHVFEEAATDNAALAAHPTLVDPGGNLVVSGPYRVAERRPGDRLVLVANPLAPVPPRTDTVIFRVIPEMTTRLAELEAGGLDVMGPVPMERAAELDADPRFRIERINDRFYDYIAWNPVAFEPFADPEVRRALSLAIDRRGILEGLGIADYARPAAGPYPPIFRRLVDPDLRPDPYLPDSARAILAARGWRDSDGDGVLDRGGRPFRFTLLTQAGNTRRSSAAEIIQKGYADVGIDMEVRLLEFNALLGLVFEERDFDAVLLGWQVALEPDYLVGHFWPADHPFNITGYGNAALDSLIPLARAAATAEEAAPYWRSAARIIAADRPYAFLWFFDDAVAVSERVRGARIDTYGLYQNLHEWRLEE
jgi:peptide/nickel transport system substrate-binding protein